MKMQLIRKSRANFRIEVQGADWEKHLEMIAWLKQLDPMPWWRHGQAPGCKIFHFRTEVDAAYFYMRWQ